MKKLILKNILLFFCFTLFYCQSRNFDKKQQTLVNYLVFCNKSVADCTADCQSDCTDDKFQLKRDGLKYVNEARAQCQNECRDDCGRYCNFSILLSQTE